MSRIRANQIVNQNNNGAPVFPKGAVINGISTITADVSLNTSQLNGVDANFSGIGTYGVVSLGTGTSISSPSDNVLVLGTNDTEAIRVTSTGSIGINTTTVTAGVNVAVAGTIRIENPSDSSQTLTITHEGIDFQNTGAGSSTTSTSHLLDDYEEGTWTPTVEYGTISDSSAIYTKIGNIVHLNAYIDDWSDITTIGTVQIQSLPFVGVSNDSTVGCVMYRYIDDVHGIGGDMVTFLAAGTNIRFYFQNSDGDSNYSPLQYRDINGTTSSFRFQITYRVT